MVNEDKVRIMTAMAREEKKYGSEITENMQFFKKDYVRSHVLAVLWSYTIAYLLLFFLIIFYNINYILLNFVVIDYLTVGMVMLFSYTLLFFLCVLISRIHYLEKYENEHRILEEYYDNVLKLKKIYAEDGKETEDVNTAGN